MEKSFDFSALLQNHEKKHKSRPTQFISVAGGVRRRLESNIKCRKSHRLTTFDSIRNLGNCESPKKLPDPISKEQHRRMQLEKWKEEKEKKKKLAAAQKKKPFVAGVAHAPLTFVPLPPLPKVVPSTSGRVTRSQAAKNNQIKPKPSKTTNQQAKTESFAPKNATFKAPQMKTKPPTLASVSKNKNKKIKEITFDPIIPNTLKVNSKPMIKSEFKFTETKSKVTEKLERKPRGRPAKGSQTSKPNPQTPDKVFQKKTISIKTSTPKNPIPKSESSSEEKLRSPKSPVDVPLTPEQIVEQAKRNSPFVTQSRGKANARRETKKKLDDGLFEEDASNVESVDHFRRQLNSEIERMTELCETWEKITEQVALPNVQEAVLGAVGQARLLMSHKMQQFATLVARCERPEPGQPLVTPADLHGFWDMVFMQVENVDLRFKKLEEMRARNWAEEAPAAVVRKAAPRAKALARPAAASRLRDIIAAARKAKKTDAQPQEPLGEAPATPVSPALEAPVKTFEAGFFRVSSPVRSPASPARPATPARPASGSMLKAVLSNEAKKSAAKNAASLAMLRASLIGKDVETSCPVREPVVPLTPINLHATPGRSILKPLNTPSAKKSIKIVLFDDSDDETRDSNDVTNDTGVNGVQKLDQAENLVIENQDLKAGQKENKPRKKSLVRQDATESSPVMTRSRRKSMTSTVPEVSEEKTPKRTSRRKKALQEVEVNIMEQSYTPRRSTRRSVSANVA